MHFDAAGSPTQHQFFVLRKTNLSSMQETLQNVADIGDGIDAIGFCNPNLSFHRKSRWSLRGCGEVDLPAIFDTKGKNMLLRRREKAQLLRRWPVFPDRPIKSMEEIAADFIFLEHYIHGFFLINRRFPGAATLGIRSERLFQLACKAKVIDYQATRTFRSNSRWQ